MLPAISVPARRVDDLIESAGEEAVSRLRAAAEPLAGARVLHLNSTAFGGGVAELLFTQVALLNDLGIDTTWKVIEGSDEFFTVTKAVHNALQGADIAWTPAMENTYLEQCRENAAALPDAGSYDFVFVHDPQPAAICAILQDEGRRGGAWIWRCHIDLSDANERVWDFFAGLISRHEGAIFTMAEFVRPGLSGPQVFIVPPSIDPTSEKNRQLGEDTVAAVLARYHVDGSRPLVTQVSRFDPWKDPLGVIDAYRIARSSVPGLQLVMIASMASDDPEGAEYLDLTARHREGDPDIHLLSNLDGVGNVEVNAFQRASAVILQKSIREGFGLVVAEGMWKGKPVVGGNVGGIRLQIEDGASGFLVNSVEECAERTCQLLSNPAERDRMGAEGHRRVRDRFLTPREVEDYLRAATAL